MKANYDYNDKEISGIGLSQKKKKKIRGLAIMQSNGPNYHQSLNDSPFTDH